MAYYFFLFSIFFLFAKLPKLSESNQKKIWLISLISLLLILGTRYYIGGDYFGYMNLYNKMDTKNFFYSFGMMEFLYYSIILICNKLGLGYYFVNLLVMFIVIFFFQYYAKEFKNPFFVLIIALPILFIPISINFTRQAIAISIFLFSIKYLLKRDFRRYLFYVIIASLFHKFAIIYIFFYLIYEKNLKEKLKYIFGLMLLVFLICLFAYYLKDNFLSIWIDKFIWHFKFYSNANYPILPKGTIFRLGMINLSFFILYYFKDFFKEYEEYRLWFSTGIISIMIIPFYFFYPLMVDRVIIFFVPIIIFVFGNIILLEKHKKIFSVNLLSLFFLIYFLVWLNFSPFKNYFTPYKSVFFL